MDFRDSPEEAAFRSELRRWIDTNLPEGWSSRGPSSGRGDEETAREWARRLFEGGYAGLTGP